MKRLFSTLLVLAMFLPGCQPGGSAGQPTEIALPGSEDETHIKAGETCTSEIDGMDQVFIPEGTFTMGGADSRAAADEKSVHQSRYMDGLTTVFNHVVRGGSFQDVETNIRVSKRSSVLGSNPNAVINSPEWLGTYSLKI